MKFQRDHSLYEDNAKVLVTLLRSCGTIKNSIIVSFKVSASLAFTDI